jgi:hypothetical protein
MHGELAIEKFPENFAAEAVRLGLATDLLMEKLAGSVSRTRGENIAPPALADEDELEQLTRPGA